MKQTIIVSLLVVALAVNTCLAAYSPIYPLLTKYLSSTTEHKYYIEDGNQPSYGGVFEPSACGVASATDPLNSAKGRKLLKSYTKSGVTRLYVQDSPIQPDGTWTFERNVGAVEVDVAKAMVSGMPILAEYYKSSTTDYIYGLKAVEKSFADNGYTFVRDVAGVYSINPLQGVKICEDAEYSIRAYTGSEACPSTPGYWDSNQYDLFQVLTTYKLVPSDPVQYQNQKKLFSYKHSNNFRILRKEGDTIPSGFTQERYLGVIWTTQVAGTQALHEWSSGSDIIENAYIYSFTAPCSTELPDCHDLGVIGYAYATNYYHCDGGSCPTTTALRSCKQTPAGYSIPVLHYWTNTSCTAGWTEDTVYTYTMHTYKLFGGQVHPRYVCARGVPLYRQYIFNANGYPIRRLSTTGVMPNYTNEGPIGCVLPAGTTYSQGGQLNPGGFLLYEYYNSATDSYQYADLSRESTMISQGYARQAMSFAVSFATYPTISSQSSQRCNKYFQNC